MTAMGDGGKEPSMEHILSSIKRIIAEDGEAQLAERRERRVKAPVLLSRGDPDEVRADDDTDVLELSDAMSQPGSGAIKDGDRPDHDEAGRAADDDHAGLGAGADSAADRNGKGSERLLSDGAAAASRSSLDQLSRMVVRPEVTGSDTLEGLVRDMLRPMLAEWLDENLPRVVDTLVAREIARITGK